MFPEALVSGNDVEQGNVALESADYRITYAELRARVESVAASLADLGVTRKSFISLDFISASKAIITALAATAIGCPWVETTHASLSNPLLFTTHRLSEKAGKFARAKDTIVVPDDWGRIASSSRFNWRTTGGSDSDLALVGQSSGTTGSAKFFPVTRHELDLRAAPELLLDTSPVPVLAPLFHPLHSALFTSVLRVLRKGGKIVFAKDPGFWLGSSVTMVQASPAHLAKIFPEGAAALATRLPSVWIGGGPIHPVFAARALRYFQKLIFTYGAQEVGIIGSFRIIDDSDNLSSTLHVGVPHGVIDLQIVDGHGHEVAGGETGEIRSRSPAMSKGYLGDDATNRVVFRDGWFYPGDEGYFDGDGHLVVVGRIGDQINVGGAKFNANALDGAVSDASGVADACVFTMLDGGGAETLAVAIKLAAGNTPEAVIADVRKRLALKVGRMALQMAVYIAEAIPRNENGKIVRREARSLAASMAWGTPDPGSRFLA